VHFTHEFGYTEEIRDSFLDVFGPFNEEVVYGLRGGDGCLNCFERWANVVRCKIFNDVDDMTHARFHQTELSE